jgi:GNAT superfamily N-acetyltransferase
MKIRPARLESDLPALLRITSPYETTPLTEEKVREFFTYNPPGRIQVRLVAVDEDDRAVAYGGGVHEATAPEGHFIVWVIVDPPHRHQGVGAALWEALLQTLQAQGGTRLEVKVLEAEPDSVAFAERRGFRLDRHMFHSFLDLAAFDESPYLDGIRQLEAAGIRFCSLEDFPDTPENRRKLYDLNYQYPPEILSVIPAFEFFDQFICQADWFCRAGQLLAVDGETWAGLAAVSLQPQTGKAYNENTVVHPDYRGRKIARALKVLAARYARRNGAARLETDNNTINAPILAINRRMGYQPLPGKFWLVRQLEAQGKQATLSA